MIWSMRVSRGDKCMLPVCADLPACPHDNHPYVSRIDNFPLPACLHGNRYRPPELAIPYQRKHLEFYAIAPARSIQNASEAEFLALPAVESERHEPVIPVSRRRTRRIGSSSIKFDVVPSVQILWPWIIREYIRHRK